MLSIGERSEYKATRENEDALKIDGKVTQEDITL